MVEALIVWIACVFPVISSGMASELLLTLISVEIVLTLRF